MRIWFIFLMLFILTGQLFAQVSPKKITGYLIDEGGMPIADAYVINYRNMYHVVSKRDGSFKISVMEGDSLCISHISFDRIAIHPNRMDSTYVLKIAEYRTSPILIDVEVKPLSVGTIEIVPIENYHTQTDISRYDPNSNKAGFGVDLLDMMKKLSYTPKRDKKLRLYRKIYRQKLLDSLLMSGNIEQLSKIDSLVRSKSYEQLKKDVLR